MGKHGIDDLVYSKAREIVYEEVKWTATENTFRSRIVEKGDSKFSDCLADAIADSTIGSAIGVPVDDREAILDIAHRRNHFTDDEDSLIERLMNLPAPLDVSTVGHFLTTLRLVDCGMTEIDESLKHLKNLRLLNLSCNRISNLPGDHLPRKLLFLELYMNEIRDVRSFSSAAPKDLTHLGLARNKLTDCSLCLEVVFLRKPTGNLQCPICLLHALENTLGRIIDVRILSPMLLCFRQDYTLHIVSFAPLPVRLCTGQETTVTTETGEGPEHGLQGPTRQTGETCSNSSTTDDADVCSGLETLSISPKTILRSLDVADNEINNMKVILSKLSTVPLSSLQLEGNPCSMCPSYVHDVVSFIPKLSYLDGACPNLINSPANSPGGLVFRCEQLTGLPENSWTYHAEVNIPLFDPVRRLSVIEGLLNERDTGEGVLWFGTEGVSWSSMVNFPVLTVRVPYFAGLTELRDIFRSTVSVRIVGVTPLSTEVIAEFDVDLEGVPWWVSSLNYRWVNGSGSAERIYQDTNDGQQSGLTCRVSFGVERFNV